MSSKSPRYALLPAILASLIWLAAPAGAAQGKRPAAAVDFTQPVPASVQLRAPSARSERVAARHNGYGLDGPVLYRSSPVEAPHRFDLVGIAGQMHSLEFRARRNGDRWSDWVETDNGDPVFTGGADQVQIRSRGVPIEGRLHYVKVDDSAIPAERMLARRSKGGGRRGGIKAPRFITRSQWGANDKRGGCKPRTKPEFGKVKAGVIHHTVTTNTYSEAQAPGIVLGICHYHRDANGWNDIGYNALVDRFGNLYEGRAGGISRPIMGAQVEGLNSQTTGIAAIGDQRTVPAGSKERTSIIRYLAWKFQLAGIDKAKGSANLLSAGGSTQRTPAGHHVRVKRIFSHSDTNYTECAGRALRAQIPGIRRAVQRKLARASGTKPPDPPPTTDPPSSGAGGIGRDSG